MISHKYKFIFIHIPKTGGNSIERHFGAWRHPRGDSRMLVGRNKEHFPLSRILKLAPRSADYFKFSFTRNPWDKVVSEWSYMQKDPVTKRARSAFSRYGKSFESFIKNNLIRFSRPGHAESQYRFLDTGKHKSSVDFIGRFENMQEDWLFICDKLNIPRFNLPHYNKSEHKHYTEYYNDETRKIVAEKYAKDIEHFGYEFGK